MNDVAIGIKLVGGPSFLDGWSNLYEADQMGGWPPPDEICAMTVGGVVAIALPENVPDDFKDDVALYRKIKQSPVPAASEHFVRGATYEYVKPE